MSGYNRGILATVLIGSIFIFSTVAYSDTESLVSCGAITYGGKGAGAVVFREATHHTKDLTCATCHESKGFSSALYEKKRYGNGISMRKIWMGLSCGVCHPVKVTETLKCEKCHRK